MAGMIATVLKNTTKMKELKHRPMPQPEHQILKTHPPYTQILVYSRAMGKNEI